MALGFDKLLLFGDSITEFGYDPHPDLLPEVQFSLCGAVSNAYTRRLDVVQRGFAGYNTDWALQLLPGILEAEHRESSKVLLSTLFFGTNDAVLNGVQKVELPQYIANTRKMVELFKERGIKVVVIGQAKHDDSNWNPRKKPDIAAGVIRTNENAQKYNAALKALCEELQVAFVDLYAAFDSYPGDWRDLLVDGVHFTGKGYELFYGKLMETIRASYPEMAPEAQRYRLPYWRDFDTPEGFNEELHKWL